MPKRLFRIVEANNSYCDYVMRACKWRHQCGDLIEGLCYDDPLYSIDGIKFILFVHDDTQREVIDRALDGAYNTRDVVAHAVLKVPRRWTEPCPSAATVGALPQA